MQNLIIVGNGKLSNAIINDFHLYSKKTVERFSGKSSATGETVFVHIGSGRQYYDALQVAIRNNSTFIQAATEKDIPMKIPKVGDFKYISAPNLDLNIVRLFYLMSLAKDLFAGEQITITESHQKEKKSKAGTAIKICNYLNCPEDNIISIRDPVFQRDLGINNLNQHAFHEIKIGNDLSSISFTTKIEGADGYVKGLACIAESILSLDNGNYEIEDLVRMKIL